MVEKAESSQVIVKRQKTERDSNPYRMKISKRIEERHTALGITPPATQVDLLSEAVDPDVLMDIDNQIIVTPSIGATASGKM